MRKCLLILVTIIFAGIFFLVFFKGIHLDGLRVYTYKEIESIGKEKKELLSVLDNKNTSQFDKTLKSLQTAEQTYEKTKNEYDKLLKEGKITDSSIYNSLDLFIADDLGEKMKDYAKKSNVLLNLNIVQSTTSTSVSLEYVMCDLEFKVSGEYSAITDFIYNIENDETLNFEIKEFSLIEEDEILRASFSIKNVPIKAKSLEE